MKTCAELGVCQSPTNPCAACGTAAPAAPSESSAKGGSYQQSVTSLAIINFVAKTGPCGFEQLAEIFEEHGTEESRDKFRRQLNHLRDSGRLKAAGTGRRRTWALGPLPYGPGQPRQRTPAPPRYVGPIVPPRRVDVMFGPVYRPGPGPALRPGALDFKSIARRGHAC